MTDLIVVGGGVTGLAAAYYAHKTRPELDITLLEAGDRPGGKLRTVTEAGFTFEAGPDSFLTRKPWAYDLARELGLDLIGTNDHRRTIYILRDGELVELPEGLRLTVPTKPYPFIRSPVMSMKGKLRALREPFIAPRRDAGDESIGAFVRRRFGEEMLRTIAEPMMAGLFVADADALSLQATFPQYARMEREHGSLIRAHRKAAAGTAAKGKDAPTMFVTPKAGTQGLVDALAEAVAGFATLIIHAQVDSIAESAQGFTLRTRQGDTISGRAVIVTTPAYTAGAMLDGINGELADLLAGIPYRSTVTVSLGYKAADFDHPLDGFGFVVPHDEETGLIAASWMSTKFDHRAPPDHVYLRAFLGEDVVDWDDHTLVRMAHGQLNTIMQFNAQPVVQAVFRWKRGSPVYSVGHLDRVERIEALCPPGLRVAGNAYRGVGIPDSVRQGKEAAQALAVGL